MDFLSFHTQNLRRACRRSVLRFVFNYIIFFLLFGLCSVLMGAYHFIGAWYILCLIGSLLLFTKQFFFSEILHLPERYYLMEASELIRKVEGGNANEVEMKLKQLLAVKNQIKKTYIKKVCKIYVIVILGFIFAVSWIYVECDETANCLQEPGRILASVDAEAISYEDAEIYELLRAKVSERGLNPEAFQFIVQRDEQNVNIIMNRIEYDTPLQKILSFVNAEWVERCIKED